MNRIWVFSFSVFCSSLVANWVDDHIASMTLEEKVGQLFIVPLSPQYDEFHQQHLDTLISSYHVGSVLAKKATKQEQIQSLKRIQKQASLPILCFMDAEWGSAMRITDAVVFPRNLTLGAIQDNTLLYELGRQMGLEMASIGGHVNFAPVLDVNTNPKNPVIHTRSFGSDPENVTQKGIAITRGLQDVGIYACAKHFPGHGDTALDSHLTLPLLSMSLDELQRIHMQPFQAACSQGLQFLMSAHIAHVTECPDAPISLSPKLQELSDYIGFQGLLVSDALNMGAIIESVGVADAAVAALKAGHTMLCYGAHNQIENEDIIQRQIPIACRAIKEAVLNGELEIEDRVRRILEIKESLQECKLKTFNSQKAEYLRALLYQKAITPLGHFEPLVPGQSIEYRAIGDDGGLRQQLERFVNIEESSTEIVIALCQLHTRRNHRYGLTAKDLDFIAQKAKTHKVRLLVLGTPYALEWLTDWDSALIGYENTPDVITALEKVLTGQCLPEGKLPI